MMRTQVTLLLANIILSQLIPIEAIVRMPALSLNPPFIWCPYSLLPLKQLNNHKKSFQYDHIFFQIFILK